MLIPQDNTAFSLRPAEVAVVETAEAEISTDVRIAELEAEIAELRAREVAPVVIHESAAEETAPPEHGTEIPREEKKPTGYWGSHT